MMPYELLTAIAVRNRCPSLLAMENSVNKLELQMYAWHGHRLSTLNMKRFHTQTFKHIQEER